MFFDRKESSLGFDQAPPGVLQYSIDLFAAYSRKPLKEFLDRSPALKVFEKGLYGNARFPEKPDPADFPGNSLHHRTICPIEHT